MNDFNPDFPADLLIEYLEHGPRKGLQRFKTYTTYRFFCSLSRKLSPSNHGVPALVQMLGTLSEYELHPDSFDTISEYLMEDSYFSPAIASDSFDTLYLYYAICITADPDGIGQILLDKLLSEHCPDVLKAGYDDASFTLDFVYENELAFWAALYICLTNYEAELPSLLPEFSRIYWKDLHFTCADFVVYDFADEYFETKDCFHKEAFQELIQTLVLATLQSFRTDVKQLCIDALFPLKHPASRFAGLYSFAGIDVKDLPSLDTAEQMMQHLLEYAAAYELRNNLFDYHLEEDNTITLDNWKEKLKWHYVQYTNVYNMAFDTFYSAVLANKLLKKQFLENIAQLQEIQ